MNEEPVAPELRATAETRADHASRVAAWCVVAVLFGVFVNWKRLYYAHYAGGAIHQAAALFLLLVWGWASLRRVRWSLGAKVLACYAVFSVGSVALADNPRLALIGSIQIVCPVAWAFLVGRLIQRRTHIRLVLRGIVLAGSLAALWALVILLSNPQGAAPSGFFERILRNRDALTHVLGHRNFLAIFLLPPILICMAELLARLRFREARGPLAAPSGAVGAAGGVMLVAMLTCGFHRRRAGRRCGRSLSGGHGAFPAASQDDSVRRHCGGRGRTGCLLPSGGTGARRRHPAGATHLSVDRRCENVGRPSRHRVGAGDVRHGVCSL